MKWLFGVVIAVVALGFPNNIAKINRLKSEAQKSYLSGDYKSAIEHYGILIDSFQISEEEILMNYANAAFLMTQKDSSPAQGVEGPVNSGPVPAGEQAEIYQQLAQNTYTSLAQNASSGIQSIAFNQLGVMTFQSAPPPKPGKDVLLQAQGLFKSALKTDQNNQQARFNYELVTKMLDQEEENQQEKQQDQQEKQEQEQENSKKKRIRKSKNRSRSKSNLVKIKKKISQQSRTRKKKMETPKNLKNHQKSSKVMSNSKNL